MPQEINNADETAAIARRLLATPAPQFNPLHLTSYWVEPGTTNRMVSVAIVLPSGVGPEDFSVRVVEGGRELELKVEWPVPLVNLEMLHKKWTDSNKPDRMEKYHPKFLGFEACLKKFRQHSRHIVESIARFALPFPVQTHIVNQYPLGWLQSACRMIYVDLKAYEEEYALERNENSFEIC